MTRGHAGIVESPFIGVGAMNAQHAKAPELSTR